VRSFLPLPRAASPEAVGFRSLQKTPGVPPAATPQAPAAPAVPPGLWPVSRLPQRSARRTAGLPPPTRSAPPAAGLPRT